MEFDGLSDQVFGCALEVHRELAPELLESTYELLTEMRPVFLINFNVTKLKDGIKRLVL